MTSFWLPSCPERPDVRVVARWRDGRASAAEVMGLRQLLPELRDRPAADVFREARSVGGWVIATCHPTEAQRVREQAERVGLEVDVEPVRVEPLPPVPDDEVVAELTCHGHAVTDFFLIGGLVCYGNANGGLMARIIEDAPLAAATRAYLLRVGARSFATYEAFVEAQSRPRPGEQEGAG